MRIEHLALYKYIIQNSLDDQKDENIKSLNELITGHLIKKDYLSDIIGFVTIFAFLGDEDSKDKYFKKINNIKKKYSQSKTFNSCFILLKFNEYHSVKKFIEETNNDKMIYTIITDINSLKLDNSLYDNLFIQI